MDNIKEGEKWYVLARVNPPTPEGFYEQPDGGKVWCNAMPATVSPISISINREYIESLLKNGGNYKIVEVKQL